MYLGTRCASFAGSFEQPTTAIVWISRRIFRTWSSSDILSSGRCRGWGLRFRREEATNRVLQGGRQVQARCFRGREPPNLGVLLVRDPRFSLPLGHEKQV